jgi:hypothetical protein
MNTSETIFFASPNPDYIFGDGARIAPNQEGFPVNAIIYVETESHFLEFGIKAKSVNQTGFAITLVDCLPPLPCVNDVDTLVVEGDILKKSQEFRLISYQPTMATQAFKALRILSNVEGLAISLMDRKI